MSRVSPSSHEASHRMARVRQKGTDAELSLRKETQLRRIAEAQSLTITRATPAGLAKAAVARWRDRLAAAG